VTEAAEVTPRRLEWRVAEVREVVTETTRVRTLVLDVPEWPGHLPGQHVDLRLTDEEGYQAHRSYSIASAPGSPHVALTVERLYDGEVSPYLVEDLRPGDQFEIRGPIGRHFVWTPEEGGPLFLVAGGSGVVPLMSMLRHRADRRSTVPTRLLYSARRFEELIYREELDRLAASGDGLRVLYTLTRETPESWDGPSRRIDREMLSDVAFPSSLKPRVYVCGPSGLVESVGQHLLELGHDASRIKTERFGPTGG